MTSNVVSKIKKLSADINGIPSSVQPILEKIRKWSVMGITPKQLLEVMPYFKGWSFTKDIVAVHLDYIDRELTEEVRRFDLLNNEGYKKEYIKIYTSLYPNSADYQDRVNRLQSAYNHFKRFEVGFVPSQPKKGVYYVVDLSNIVEVPIDKPMTRISFEAKFYRGSIGFRITTPEGKTFAHNEMSKIWWWLKDNSHMKEEAAEILGLAAHVPASQRTRENTGSCSVCNQNIKLKPTNPPVMVLHGFQRPGIGYVIGDCGGVGWPPYEISADGCKNYIEKVLRPNLVIAEQYLNDLYADRVDTLDVKDGPRRIKVHPGDEKWDRAYKIVCSQTIGAIESLEADIKFMNKRIADWIPKPLP